MTLFFSPVKRARHASVARQRRARIFREILRALVATRAPASNGLSVAVDATAAGEAAGRTGEAAIVVIGEDVRDSNAVAPAGRAMTAAIRAGTPAHPGAHS
jgi:hypothetical protein